MVMKKTKRKHLLRTIKKSGVSFFAVAFIATTSIAMFLGLQSSALAILKHADNYFVSNRLETLQIACANGITQEDIDAIAEWENVKAVEGGYSDTAMLDIDGEKILLQVNSLLENMNDPTVLEGTLPIEKNEVAIEELLAKEKGVQVGDEITVEHEGNLVSDKFIVTAIINEPSYCCSTLKDARGKNSVGLGSNEYYIEIPKEAFDSSYYSDCYTTAHVTSSTLDGIYFYSDAYAEKEEELLEELEPLAKERAQLRYTSLKDDAQMELDDAQAEIADGEKELSDAKEEFDSQKSQLEDARAEIEGQLAMLNLSTDMELAKEQLLGLGQEGEALLSVITEYQESEKMLQEAEAEISDSEVELEDAKQELEDTKKEVNDIELKDWILSGRNSIGDVRGVKTTVSCLDGLSISLPAIFLIVSVVVCYAAIAKMIDEQKIMIGAQKALGFTSKEILKHYMLYNILCSVLGIVLGWIASVGIVEILVLYIFTERFVFGNIELTFAWPQALLAGGLYLIVFLVATYATCVKLVRLPATTLLRGEMPSRKKGFFFEKWKGYKKLNLYSRTMIKNVMNDKGRMMTTITGVMGCIALLIICFSMKMGIENASVVQFDKYFLYDNRLVVDSKKENPEEFAKVLKENDIEYTLIQDKLYNFRAGEDDWENGHIIAVDDAEELADFIYLEDIKSKKTTEIPTNGLLVSRKCAEMFGLSKGSTIELMDSNGRTVECEIAGVIEHYLSYHLFVTSKSYFESVMGEDVDSCVFLLKGNIDGIKDQVSGMNGYLSLKDNSDDVEDASSINAVIIVCLVLSLVLVLLILMNQVVMYINKKSKELSVMRINGYTLKETKAFVYKDNVVLVLLGLILGCGSGIGLAYVIIRIIETGACRYVRTPNLLACIYSCAMVAVFAIIVNVIALKKINHLNLTNVSAN